MRPKLASIATQKVLTQILLLVSLEVTAQTSHWRLGFQAGTATTRSEFKTTPAIPANQLKVITPVGFWWQVHLERSVTSHLSLKLGLGQMRLPYTIANTISLVDASGRIVQTTGFASGRADQLSYTSLGLTANSSALGPLIFTVGIDLTLRYNPEAKSARPYGSWSEFTLVSGQDTLRSTQSSSFTPQSVPTLSVAVAPRVGIDVRVSKRTFVAATATYSLGLGSVQRSSLTSDINGQSYSGLFSHNGSLIGYQAGIKYALGQVRSLSRLQYTAYNRPEPKVAWYRAEQERTFKKGYWLVGGRVSYFSERFSNGFDLSGQAQGGYFVADRLAVGLRGKYIRDYRSSSFPITRSWLIGPVVRYHLTSTRIAPFVEGAYQVGRVGFDGAATSFPYPTIRETVRVLSLVGGLSVRLNPALRLDLAAETQQFSYYPSNRKKTIRPGLGLTYYLR